MGFDGAPALSVVADETGISGTLLVTTSKVEHVDTLAALARTLSGLAQPGAIGGFVQQLSSGRERLTLRGSLA